MSNAVIKRAIKHLEELYRYEFGQGTPEHPNAACIPIEKTINDLKKMLNTEKVYVVSTEYVGDPVAYHLINEKLANIVTKLNNNKNLTKKDFNYIKEVVKNKDVLEDIMYTLEENDLNSFLKQMPYITIKDTQMESMSLLEISEFAKKHQLDVVYDFAYVFID